MSKEKKEYLKFKPFADDLRKAESWCELDGVLNRYQTVKNLSKMGYRKQSENVIELPCKIGDTIYLPWEWNGQKGIACLTVTVLRCIVGFGWSFGTDFDTDDEDYYEAYNCGSFKLKDFGKIVFLSREEAEKALAKMKEVNNERRKAD